MSITANLNAVADELWASLEAKGYSPMLHRLSEQVIRVSWWQDGCNLAAYYSPTGNPSQRIVKDASGTFARFFSIDSRGFVHYESETRLLGGTFTNPSTVDES